MRSRIFLFGVTLAMLAGLTLSGCDSATTAAGGGGTGTTDPGLVGVWFTLSDTSGFDIKSDGTAIPLSVDNTGKIVTVIEAGITYKITTSGTTITVTQTGKSSATGKDTSVVVATASYALSNSNNTLTITGTDNGSTFTLVYFKTSVGANAFTGGGGGGGGTNTLTFVVDGTTYNGSVMSPAVTSGFFYATGIQSSTSLYIMVEASTGTKNVSANIAYGALTLSGVTYTSTGGSITVTAFTSSNIKGTFNLSLTQDGGSGTKTVTGSFDINY